MILVDATVWCDHLRRADPQLRDLLARRLVLGHPHVRGEIGLGSLANRAEFLERLDALPQSIVADHLEVVTMVERRKWFAQGIGYVDAHLLASLILTPGSRLWTREAALERLAAELGRSFNPAAGSAPHTP